MSYKFISEGEAKEFHIGNMAPVVGLTPDSKDDGILSHTPIEDIVNKTNKEIDDAPEIGKDLPLEPTTPDEYKWIDDDFNSLQLKKNDVEEEADPFEGSMYPGDTGSDVIESDDSDEEDDEPTTEGAKDIKGYDKIDDDIKEVIVKLNDKGYTTKYSCSGHPASKRKGDINKDGVFYGKLYSTARVVFDKVYRFDSIPKGWIPKILDDDKSAIYVKEPSYKVGKEFPIDQFYKWKKDYMDSLKKWVDELPENGKKEKDIEKESGEKLESVINDLYIDSLPV